MLVFVTGASGFIGRAMVEELLTHGHQVLGLARSDASAETLTRLGAQVHRGSLNDVESLRRGAKAADGIIHLAFNHDFTDYRSSALLDQAAIQAMGDAIAGTGKPLVIASGTLIAQLGKLAHEDDEPDRSTPFAIRQEAADLVTKLSAETGIRGSTVRLPPTVHGKGDIQFIPMIAEAARKIGHAVIIGDGANVWPAVHRLDAVVVFRLALEKGSPGAIYHAVAEEGVPMKDIMAVVGRRLQIPVESKTVEEAMADLGFIAVALGGDNPTSSEKTQRELGWNPAGSGQPGLLADLEANYFI
jgi:nucleoside-diphosphate-sugar epimerase